MRGNGNYWKLKWEEIYKLNRIIRGIETIKHTLSINQTDPQFKKNRSSPGIVRFYICQPLVAPQTSASPMLELMVGEFLAIPSHILYHLKSR
jgi:hypothetical protein